MNVYFLGGKRCVGLLYIPCLCISFVRRRCGCLLCGFGGFCLGGSRGRRRIPRCPPLLVDPRTGVSRVWVLWLEMPMFANNVTPKWGWRWVDLKTRASFTSVLSLLSLIHFLSTYTFGVIEVESGISVSSRGKLG